MSTGLPSSAALFLTELACVRNDRMLFSGLSLNVVAGQAALITGPNAVGKSSLLRLIAGLLRPAAGQIERHGKCGLCEDRLPLDGDQTLVRALMFWARVDGVAHERLTAAMAAAGIDHLADIPVRLFSTGQRQRARLAMLHASASDIWLLDEPVNGLDSAGCDALGAMLDMHLAAGGIALVASHIAVPGDYVKTLDLAEFAS